MSAIIGIRTEDSRPTVDALILAGSLELSLALGIRKTRVLAETQRLGRNMQLGWTSRPLGPAQEIDGISCTAIEKDVSEEIWVGVCRRLSVPGPILIWNGTAKPSYSLADLVRSAA